MEWLLDSDPSIRWQVMRDLANESEQAVAAVRARVATEGWGARLLERQRPDGTWGDGSAAPVWSSTLHTLQLLWAMGLDPTCEQARRAVDLLRDKVTWGPGFDNSPFFEGETEPNRPIGQPRRGFQPAAFLPTLSAPLSGAAQPNP